MSAVQLSGEHYMILELESLIHEWMSYYNHRRKHQHLKYRTPWSIYEPPTPMAA